MISRNVVLSFMFVAVLTFAQEDFHRHNIVVGVGAAIPVGNTTTYLGTAPLVSVG